jgi:hypothetical protein
MSHGYGYMTMRGMGKKRKRTIPTWEDKKMEGLSRAGSRLTAAMVREQSAYSALVEGVKRSSRSGLKPLMVEWMSADEELSRATRDLATARIDANKGA